MNIFNARFPVVEAHQYLDTNKERHPAIIRCTGQPDDLHGIPNGFVVMGPTSKGIKSMQTGKVTLLQNTDYIVRTAHDFLVIPEATFKQLYELNK